MDLTRRRFLAASGAVLASCGGGGATYIGAPPAPPRSGILYGYYGDDVEQAAEVAGHTNLYLSAPWDGLQVAIDNIGRARAAGLADFVVICSPPVIDVPGTIAAVSGWLSALASGLQGANLRGVYWADEPNSLPDAFVRAVNKGLRQVTTAPLWTIFADNPGRPGLDAADDPAGAWDVVGLDQYDIGCNVLGGLYDDLGRQMKAGARRILVPGPVGGHLSQADPSCFENFAYSHSDILAIVPFIWRDRWNVKNLADPGIRSIPSLRATYTALGKRLTGKP